MLVGWAGQRKDEHAERAMRTMKWMGKRKGGLKRSRECGWQHGCRLTMSRIKAMSIRKRHEIWDKSSVQYRMDNQ